MSEKVKARQEALRMRLIESAERQIVDQGRAGLRARVLAQEAGCSVGSIYFLFADLDALVAEVNRRSLAALGEEIRDALERARGTCPEDRMVAFAQTYARFAARNLALWLAMMTRSDSLTKDDDVYEETVGVLVTEFSKTLPQEFAESGKGSLTLAETIFSAMHGVVLVGLTRVPQQSTEQLDFEVDLLVRQFDVSSQPLRKSLQLA